MMRGNRTDLGSRVEQFFNDNAGEHSVKQVAEAMGLAPNTIGQYALSLYDWGALTRRMEGVARGRHYIYRKADTPILIKGDTVWYDDDCGEVLSVSGGGLDVQVEWSGGITSTVRRSDLLTDKEYHDAESA